MISRGALLVASALLPSSCLCAVGSGAIVTSTAGRGSGSHLRRKGFGSDDTPPECSCDCCEVEDRKASELNFGVNIKCGPSTGHSEEKCSDQCSPSKSSQPILDSISDSNRFCFFECKPASGVKAPQKSQCVAFSADEAAKVLDPDGNPMDPGFLYAPHDPSAMPSASFYSAQPGYTPPGAAATGNPQGQSLFPPGYNVLGATTNLLSTRAKLVRAAPGAKVAEAAAIRGKASSEAEGKDARTAAGNLREMEHLKQQELNKGLKESGNGVVAMDPLSQIQDLSAAAAQAKTSAENAAVTAAAAVKSYDQGRKKIWKLAVSAAGKEVEGWKNAAENKAAEDLKARMAPTWQSNALGVAQKASKPYIDGLLRAQESAKLYNAQGAALANQASALWKESAKEADEANKLPRATSAQTNAAQATMLDAREKAQQAQNVAVQSKQYFATATEVQKSVPVYQYNAQKAAAQAVAGMKTA